VPARSGAALPLLGWLLRRAGGAQFSGLHRCTVADTELGARRRPPAWFLRRAEGHLPRAARQARRPPLGSRDGRSGTRRFTDAARRSGHPLGDGRSGILSLPPGAVAPRRRAQGPRKGAAAPARFPRCVVGCHIARCFTAAARRGDCGGRCEAPLFGLCDGWRGIHAFGHISALRHSGPPLGFYDGRGASLSRPAPQVQLAQSTLQSCAPGDAPPAWFLRRAGGASSPRAAAAAAAPSAWFLRRAERHRNRSRCTRHRAPALGSVDGQGTETQRFVPSTGGGCNFLASPLPPDAVAPAWGHQYH